VREAQRKFYVTTPIYYPNRPPHIGSAYTTVMADVLARYYESMGFDIFYLTGTDEHGMKLYKEAKTYNMSPKEFVDRIVPKFVEAWRALDIRYHRFIRTTEKQHEDVVKEIAMKIYEKGDIYKGIYKGLYCVECERYYTKKELKNGNLCPIHLKPVEYLEMECYFFRLSKYQDSLLRLYSENSRFILPEERKNYIIKKINEEGLKDVSISRPKWYLPWGIECPWDPDHVLYVWIDALLNYISGVGYSENREIFEKFWPPDVQLIGKDILWFHVVIWPALLMSLGLPLPRTIFAHGFLTVEGKKISKSLGTDIDPIDLVNKYGSDAVRYYLCRAIPFGEDGDFSEKELVTYYNNELVNEIGNLAFRVLSLAERYFGGVVPEIKGHTEDESKVSREISEHVRKYHEFMRNLQIHHAVMEIILVAQSVNAYLNKTEPWKRWKEGDKERTAVIVRHALDWIYVINALIYPFMPSAARRLAKQLGLNSIPKLANLRMWGNLRAGHKLGKREILFRKLERS